MLKEKFDLMSEEELRELNDVVVPCFGQRIRIVSGSLYLNKRRKVHCYITLGETNVYQSAMDIKAIGKKVKSVINADEVYCSGIRVA